MDDLEERAFLTLINDFRNAHGLVPLSRCVPLDHVASAHAHDMGRRGFFGHTNPDGKSPFDRLHDAGYSGGLMGENIASGGYSARDVFAQWEGSTGHRQAMLEPRYRVIGVGRALSRDSAAGVYWATVFGDVLP